MGKKPKYRVDHPGDPNTASHVNLSYSGRRHYLYGPSGFLAEVFCSCQFANRICRLLNTSVSSKPKKEKK